VSEEMPPFPETAPKKLTVISYNIHAGMGLTWKRIQGMEKFSFYQRLDSIADILQNSKADIVLLQEVDFSSKRTQNIDQAAYLAKKAGYPYYATGLLLKEKFHPSFHGLHGQVNHGLCVLSKFPIEENLIHIFKFPKEMPFYLKWIYPPHGAQKITVNLGNKKLTLFNVHLEPWVQQKRERESIKLADWVKTVKSPVIVGGDFNALCPYASEKKGYYLHDAPWFIDKTTWNIPQDQTIQTLLNLPGFSELVASHAYKNNEKETFTYPSNAPKEKIDYIFSGNGIRIIYGFVNHNAFTASDHLPIVAVLGFPRSTQPKAPPSQGIQANNMKN
jgi:endonuclease/exonuclease/phosphatase family metal-dependent hydrolase